MITKVYYNNITGDELVIRVNRGPKVADRLLARLEATINRQGKNNQDFNDRGNWVVKK